MASLRLLTRLANFNRKSLRDCNRLFSDSKKPPPENPIKRSLRMAKNEFKGAFAEMTGKKFEPELYEHDNDFPINHADIVIIGGGVIGSSVAYYLKELSGKGVEVCVIEKDPTYKEASTVLSVGGLRQQFSMPENILMSQYAAEFFRDIKRHLGEHVDLQFTPHGYLLLATDSTAETLKSNYNLQQEYNVKNELLTAKQLKEQFPWLNTDDIALGCRGLQNEGWFDPWALLYGFKKKAIDMGTVFVQGEVVGFDFEATEDVYGEAIAPGTYERPVYIVAKSPSGKLNRIKFSLGVIAAGARSGDVAKMCQIGQSGKNPLLSFPLPVEPRKRYVYCFSCKHDKSPGLNTPMVFDPSGTYFRREGLGNTYIAGRAPLPEEEPDISNLDVDYEFFDSQIWPFLANRVPAFNEIKVNGGWAGYYEFNTFDENGIIGVHPHHNNIYIATGFSGHGIQQAPAVGRAIAELILEGQYITIDLTRMGFDRLLTGDAVFEANIF